MIIPDLLPDQIHYSSTARHNNINNNNNNKEKESTREQKRRVNTIYNNPIVDHWSSGDLGEGGGQEGRTETSR